MSVEPKPTKSSDQEKPKDKKSKPKQTKRIVTILAVLILVVGVGVAGYFLYKHFKQNADKEASTPAVTVCNDDMIERYNALMLPLEGREELMTAEIDKITDLNGYLDDVNCVYMLVQYYSDTGSYAQALQFVDFYRDRLEQGAQLSRSINSSYTPDELQNYIEFRLLAG